MDQQAFRQLISTPRSDDVGQSSSSSSQHRYSGKPKKAAARDIPTHSADLLPRKVGGGSKKASSSSSSSSKEKEKVVAVNSATGESYIDRAEARRLEEERERQFEQHSRDDEEHQTTIVKGLDYALLAQEKAKVNGNGTEVELDDDDLEEAYGSGGLVEGLKEVSNKEEVVKSKFKPIGFKSVDKEDEGQPEYIWRDGKRMRKKKKKKPALENGGDGEGTAGKGQLIESKSVGESSKARENDGQEHTEKGKRPSLQEKIAREREEMPPPQLLPSSVPNSSSSEAAQALQIQQSEEQKVGSDESDNDSIDIFADAGRWNALGDDDDEEEEEKEEGEAAEFAPVIPPSSSGKRDWFNTGTAANKQGDTEEVTLPSSLTSILDNVHKAKESQYEAPAPAESESSGSDEEDGEAKPERLEGFSDSILGREGVRYLLDKKDDERNNQQRKRKRSKKGKGGYGSD